MHGNRVKINIFKCNKFNILSHIFCFSSFFNGSAFSLYCVAITSLSLPREMRPPDSTNFISSFFHSFFHFTKTYSKVHLAQERGTVLCAGDTTEPAHTNHCPLGLTVYLLTSLPASGIPQGTQIGIS